MDYALTLTIFGAILSFIYLQVIINLWSADMDPTVWTEPEKFQPDRFLDDNKSTIKNREKLSNFSFGKSHTESTALITYDIMCNTIQ